ncbi:hypothetical protein MRS76_11230 [Rhizobiaceae bacterium n13]|uniref:hypothetical protein n=1 Tax=Ferirhizobium litorale TaxID=2927786 RepID=UPI0024B29DF7|nr:hypothetical protein [Fererhizobium litorale]MDI7862533.1 hypothetical protein [Fererhizobium litorale]
MDKLTILNNALRATGNNSVNVLNDPSDEYQVANPAFERAIRFLTSRHTWPFATTNELLVRVPDGDNKSRRFSQNGFRLPPNTLHVKEVFWNTTFLTDYEIMGTVLSCRYDSEIYATVVKAPPADNWHPMAEEILTLYVEAGCLRGLNEDFSEATRREQRAELLLEETRPHLDQQNPARNIYKSKIADARRRRRV